MKNGLSPVPLSFDVPVATPAATRRGSRLRTVLGAVRRDINVQQIAVEDTDKVASISLIDPAVDYVVRRHEGTFMVTLPVAINTRTVIPFTPSSARNALPSETQKEALTRTAKNVSELDKLWHEWREKPLRNILDMRLAEIDKDVIESQLEAQTSFLLSLRIIDGQLFRPCDEPFIRLCCGKPNHLTIAFERSAATGEEWGIYSLVEYERAIQAGSFISQNVNQHPLVARFKVSSLDEGCLQDDLFGKRLASMCEQLLWSFRRATGSMLSNMELVASMDQLQRSRLKVVADLATVGENWSAADQLRSRADFLFGDDVRPFAPISSRTGTSLRLKWQLLNSEVDDIATAFRF